MLVQRVAQVCILLISTSVSLIVAEIAQRARHPWHAIAPLRIPAPAGQSYQVNAPSWLSSRYMAGDGSAITPTDTGTASLRRTQRRRGVC